MTCDMRKNPDSSGKSLDRTSLSSHMQPEGTKNDSESPTLPTRGYLCACADLDFAFGFCGVPSTRTIGPFIGCVCVVIELLLAAASASTFAGGTFGPSFRRPLNALDMLTSR